MTKIAGEKNHHGRALAVVLSVLALIVSSVGAAEVAAADKQPVGTVTMDQMSVAFIGSANFGDGKLMFQGKTYPFKVSGLGIGGIGISTIDAKGEVYELKDVADFPGAYGQARAGMVFGTVSKGSMWLENTKGVVLNLKAKREGLALTLGADGVVIQMDN
jgi:hypothetical protein